MAFFYDNHIHSNFSPDSKLTVREIVSAAEKRGLNGIAITDHFDIDAPRIESEFIFKPIDQQAEINRIAAETSVEILKGVEIGLQPNSLEKIQKFTSEHKFDTIIASIHFVDGTDPYFGDYYIGKNYKEAYSRLFEIMYQTAVEYADFDILGHFDYIVRYAPYPNSERDITLSEFGDYLDPILKFLAQNGKALEINTKTYIENKGHTPLLDLNILKRLREHGADAISLGSDSHDIYRLGADFEKFAALSKECGFKYLVYYRNRKPIYYSI